MSQLKISELYTTINEKNLKRLEIYDSVLVKCHKRIEYNSKHEKTYCFYQIPEFIIGVPLFDVVELRTYLMNSLDLSQLKLYVLEDAEFAEKGLYFAAINRIPESINKCQYLVFAETLSARLKRFEDTFMYRAQTIKVK